MSASKAVMSVASKSLVEKHGTAIKREALRSSSEVVRVDLGQTGMALTLKTPRITAFLLVIEGFSGQPDSQPFALSVVRAAGEVEAPPGLDGLSPLCPSTSSLPNAVAIHSHSPRTAFSLRQEPAPGSIRGRTGVK